MHIAFVIPDLKGGGAQKMMINLANEFSARGDHVDLVLFNQSGTYQKDIEAFVNIVDLDKNRAAQSIGSLKRYIKDKSPDVMVSALLHVNLVAIISRLFSGHKKTKLIVTERNYLSQNLSTANFFNHFFLKNMVKFLYPYADKVIGISNGVCDDLRDLINPNDKSFIQTIYNPVVTKDFIRKLKHDSKNIFPDNAGVKLIASGRLVIQKDYPTLFKALALYQEKYGAVHLAVLGDGALKNDLLEMANQLNIKENISFLGFVENPLSYMKQADIFVVSSAWEGFCNVIVEALYSGLKIVSTDCFSGPSEILQNGKYGELIPVGNALEFSEGIYRTAQANINPENQKNRAQDFTVEKISDEFENLFQEVLKS